jgi:hypothetical protein
MIYDFKAAMSHRVWTWGRASVSKLCNLLMFFGVGMLSNLEYIN